MANTLGSDNPFPSVLLAEHVDPSTPDSGFGRLFLDTDKVLKWIDDAGTVTECGGSSGLTDPMTTRGDLMIRNASNVTDRLAVGSSGKVLKSDGVDPSWQTPTFAYAIPVPTSSSSQFSSSSTTCAVTTAAFTTGDKLIAIVAAGSRGCNSITQTNVTWTQRYASSGNSNFVEVWTGVVSGTAGTTATFNFTGSGTQQCAVVCLNEAPSAFTAAASIGTDTSGSSSTHQVTSTSATAGRYCVLAIAAQATSHTLLVASQPYAPQLVTGGRLAYLLGRSNFSQWHFAGIKNTATSHFAAIVELS